MTLTDFDKALLQLLQRSVPLVRRPFEQLARELGRSEPDVIARVGELSADGGVIREIAGIFDATLLGYRSMLAGMKVPPSHLDDAGKIVSAHPGVSHCYSRPAAYNLWFTLVCPPDSSLGLEGTAQRLAKLCEVQQVLLLPVLRRYKLRVNIPLGEGPAESLAEEPTKRSQRPEKRTNRPNEANGNWCGIQGLSRSSSALVPGGIRLGATDRTKPPWKLDSGSEPRPRNERSHG